MYGVGKLTRELTVSFLLVRPLRSTSHSGGNPSYFGLAPECRLSPRLLVLPAATPVGALSALCASSLRRWRMPARAQAVLSEASPVDPILAFRGVRRSGAVGKDFLSVRSKRDPCSVEKRSLFQRKKIPVPEVHGSAFSRGVRGRSEGRRERLRALKAAPRRAENPKLFNVRRHFLFQNGGFCYSDPNDEASGRGGRRWECGGGR